MNPMNPRVRHSELEEDELLNSVDSKGIINPIIVYEKKGFYHIVDGERRYKAAKKLKMKALPARVLDHEPSELENLSMMFHIHNIAEEWSEMAIALTIQRIRNATGTSNVSQISKITSLSAYKIKKYLKILDFPEKILDRFLESEMKEKPDLDVDFLTEIHTPISRIEKTLPALAQRFPREKFVEICIEKKRDGIIQKNKEFRDLGRIVLNAKRGKINKDVAAERIAYFLEEEDVTIEQVYSETSEAIDQAKELTKTCIRLTDDIRNIDLRKVPEREREELRQKLRLLLSSIKPKIE